MPDLIPTVTAFVGSVPNLGGVLGVTIVGAIIANSLNSELSRVLPPGSIVSLLSNEKKTFVILPFVSPCFFDIFCFSSTSTTHSRWSPQGSTMKSSPPRILTGSSRDFTRLRARQLYNSLSACSLSGLFSATERSLGFPRGDREIRAMR